MIRKGKWDEEEVDYLKRKYGKVCFKDMANNLNRSCNSISYKVLRLKLGKEFGGRFIAPNVNIEFIDRKYDIYSEIVKVGYINDVYRRWLKNEVEFLKNNYKKGTVSVLNRTASAIRQKARKLGLRKKVGEFK